VLSLGPALCGQTPTIGISHPSGVQIPSINVTPTRRADIDQFDHPRSVAPWSTAPAGRSGYLLFAAAGVALALLAWLMLAGRVSQRMRLPVVVLSWVVSGTLLLILPANLIMRLAFLEADAGATTARAVSFVAGGVFWAWAALAFQRETGAGCNRCGRVLPRVEPGAQDRAVVDRAVMPPSTVQRRLTLAAAVIPVIGFTVPHWLWALGVPFGALEAQEMRESSAVALWILGVVPLLGAVLTIGLIRDWGQVFLGWMPLIGGRGVPRWLAVVPPTIVGLMLAQYGAMMTRCVGGTVADAENIIRAAHAA
jgi:hypothetical protein